MRRTLIGLIIAAGAALTGCSQDVPAEASAAQPVTTLAMTPEAVMERWESELGARFRAAAVLEEAAFIEVWDADLEAWHTELDAAGAETVDFERTRYEWAFGRMLYPVLHARLTGEPRQPTGPGYDAYLEAVDLGRADLLELEEYVSFITTRAEMTADRLYDDPAFLTAGRAQYLDARLAATQDFEDPAVRCFLQAGIFEYWVESYDGNGLRDQLEDFAAACPGDRTDTIVSAFAAERAALQSVPSQVYKTVDGHELSVFITLPDGHRADDRRPAALFFHGGGWFFGNWSWCGPCRFFKERDHVVIQVEYRNRGRFRTRAGDALDDAIDAVAWVRANADALGVDPNRIAATGFSAGAHLSMTMGALLEPGHPGRPDLIAAFSGCSAMDDSEYPLRQAGSLEEAVRLSPVRLEAPISPPVFFANARRDSDCDFETVSAYAAKLEAGGSTVAFHDGGQRGHFFMRDPEAAAAVQADLNAFLDAQGW